MIHQEPTFFLHQTHSQHSTQHLMQLVIPSRNMVGKSKI